MLLSSVGNRAWLMQSSTTLCIVDALCDIVVHAANVIDDLLG